MRACFVAGELGSARCGCCGCGCGGVVVSDVTKRLVLNAGFGVQFEGDYHANGSPKNIAKVHYREDSLGNDDGFHDRANIVRKMVELWNNTSSISARLKAADRLADAAFDIMVDPSWGLDHNVYMGLKSAITTYNKSKERK